MLSSPSAPAKATYQAKGALSASFTRQTVAVTSLKVSMLSTSGARWPGVSTVLSVVRPWVVWVVSVVIVALRDQWA